MENLKLTGGDVNRRDFMKTSGKLAGLGLLAFTGAAAANLRANPPSDRITVGVIGTGARAQQLMEAVVANPGTEIVSVCDAYQGRLTRTQERFGKQVKIVPSYKDILADKSIDVVVIATPDHWHKNMAIEAVEAGKDVYIEKPLTYTVDEGVEIIAAVKKSGRVFQVGSQGISSPMQRKAREVINSGKLGQITMVRAHYNRNTASGAWIYPIPPDASPETVNWKQFIGPAPMVPFNLERFFQWRCYKDYSGGIPTDLFVHLCTTIHFLMGVQVPSRVIGMGAKYRWKDTRDVADTVNASVQYGEGFMANLSTTFNNESAGGEGFQILGTEGTLTIGWDKLTFQPEVPFEDNEWVVRSWAKKLHDQYNNDPARIAYVQETKAREAAAKVEDIAYPAYAEGEDSNVLHFKHFFECVRNRTTPEENAVVGHHAAAVAHMVNRSIETGSSVVWDFENDRMMF